jgi:hypothetical protein
VHRFLAAILVGLLVVAPVAGLPLCSWTDAPCGSGCGCSGTAGKDQSRDVPTPGAPATCSHCGSCGHAAAPVLPAPDDPGAPDHGGLCVSCLLASPDLAAVVTRAANDGPPSATVAIVAVPTNTGPVGDALTPLLFRPPAVSLPPPGSAELPRPLRL